MLDRIREALGGRDDVDPCARVALTLRDGAIGVEVALPDGRSAHRSVSRSEDVVPMLEALVIVPEASREASESSTPSARLASAPSTASAPGPPDATPASTPSTAVPARESASMPLQPSQLRIELSAATGVRVGDGQTGVGLGALSFLDLSGWLLGFAGRVDRYRMLTGAASSGALELALLGGRRFWFRTMALDLAAGPAVALGGTTTYSSQPSNGNEVSGSATNTVPRLLLEARLAFGARSTVHTFVGLDGDFGPARSPDAGLLNAPRLPIWTLGLALGATVGTQ
jgi:hypothetical protein